MIFLKLGGSLITDKTRAETPETELIQRVALEIAEARASQPELRLLLGHGSGSFGHAAAARHRTHLGASTEEDWSGFLEVWEAAHRLHRQVLMALQAAGSPALSFPPSASAVCERGHIISMAAEPVERALQAGLLPVVLGDVAFDRVQGAAIVSTEQVMAWLATQLKPSKILLAGLESGVYAKYPERDRVLEEITEADLPALQLADPVGPDVTGGMADKLRWAWEMLGSGRDRGLELRIFSGSAPGAIRQALTGEPLGTRVRLAG